jgi:hypothetical protein
LDFFFLIARFSALIIFENIEAIVEAKVSEKIGVLRDEIHGTTQFMKSHVKKLKSDSQYKWRSEGNTIQFNSSWPYRAE